MSRDFEVFKKEFKKWQQRFGLNGWKVYFKHEPLDSAFAEIETNLDGMVATVILNSKLPDKDKPFKEVKRSAKHEAIHLLTARLEYNGRARFSSSAEIYESAEELNNKLYDLIR